MRVFFESRLLLFIGVPFTPLFLLYPRRNWWIRVCEWKGVFRHFPNLWLIYVAVLPTRILCSSTLGIIILFFYFCVAFIFIIIIIIINSFYLFAISYPHHDYHLNHHYYFDYHNYYDNTYYHYSDTIIIVIHVMIIFIITLLLRYTVLTVFTSTLINVLSIYCYLPMVHKYC